MLPGPLLLPGFSSELYLLGDKCYAVGVGVFSPFGTFALLAATFFSALAIDWVRAAVAPLSLSLSLCFAAFLAQLLCAGRTLPLALTLLHHRSLPQL